MKIRLIALLILTPILIFGQDCDCLSNFDWLKETFEENDAGFAYSIETKGITAYQLHNDKFRNEIREISSPSECYQKLYQWLRFFRSGHIGITPLNQQDNNSAPIDVGSIKEQFKDWEKINVELEQFKTNLTSNNPNNIEGIWVSEPYEIGIKKSGNEYLGFIIKADGVYWSKGQIKLRIKDDGSATYYMRDHSAQEFDNYQLLGSNILEIGFITLERKFPKYKTDENIERYFRSINAQSPFFESINEKINLLRIPSFWGEVKPNIDSLIQVYKEEILTTPNLIIDVRNNGGGDDRSYYELLPIIYTDTIRTVGVEFLSTPLNNQRMNDFANNSDYKFEESEVKEFKKYYSILSKNIGKFVNLDTALIDVIHYDTIYPYPKNVAIIINEGNASTTEQFLLAAKQSQKVKLFGTRTFGSLDVSNMNFVKSPCNEFELGYCLSKSYRIPEMAIDEVGIQPDYYINKTVPKYKWIHFVMQILKE